MPIYEYRCASCGEQVEAIQKMSDAPLTTCKACGEEALKRIISQTSFVLKGTGWYVTDYKSGGGGGGEKSAPAEAKAPAPASSTPD